MPNIYAKIIETIERGETATLKTEFSGNEGVIAENLKKKLSPYEAQTDTRGRRFADVTLAQSNGRTVVGEPFSPPERLIVLGAGHIALPVCDFAAKSGFDVYVCDDRPAFANTARFPMAQEVLCDSFENCIGRLKLTGYDYVVVITRGHTHDADCLRAIFKGAQPAYLGLIGSRRRVRGLFDMLADEGFPQKYMDRICTPIGLSIGAVTPGEIAISILAELVAYKRLPEHSNDGIRCCNDSDVELSVIKYLASNHEPKAVVTVIETKGSTPREAGAKMAVSPCGNVTGSIGGGCSEGAVIREAVDLIGTGCYKVIDIDLTGEVAESEGMVCGGTMKVLVEDGTER